MKNNNVLDSFNIKSDFNNYAQAFLEENSKHNLISKNDEKFLWEKHIYDSFTVSPVLAINFPSE